MEQLQQLMSMMNAGCSALSWKTQDGKHLWGRNMDFNRLAQGSKISFIPRAPAIICAARQWKITCVSRSGEPLPMRQ